MSPCSGIVRGFPRTMIHASLLGNRVSCAMSHAALRPSPMTTSKKESLLVKILGVLMLAALITGVLACLVAPHP